MFKQEPGDEFSNKNMYMPLFNIKHVNVGGREKGLMKFFLLFSSHLENTDHGFFLSLLIARHLLN